MKVSPQSLGKNIPSPKIETLRFIPASLILLDIIGKEKKKK